MREKENELESLIRLLMQRMRQANKFVHSETGQSSLRARRAELVTPKCIRAWPRLEKGRKGENSQLLYK